MTIEIGFSSHYNVGGILPINSPSYVVRQADHDLYETLKRGEYCHVLNARQMGKTSLRNRVMQKLQEEDGIVCAELDLSGFSGSQSSIERWYSTIGTKLANSLKSFLPQSFEYAAWSKTQELLTPAGRFDKFIEEILLVNITKPVIFFLDEIDAVLRLAFSPDDFFALIRSFYNKRNGQSAHQRLTFCLLGVATPSDLIQDKRGTPYNIGRAIELSGFTLNEVEPLAKGLRTKTDNPQTVLKEVLGWTGGQPFLTQKVCQLILNEESRIPVGKERQYVDYLVQTKIVENWQGQDDPSHLRDIRDRIEQAKRIPFRLLNLYRQILEQSSVPADNSPEQAELQLTGLVVKDKKGNILRVYNRIYQNVFNLQWIAKETERLRPHEIALRAWIQSEGMDSSKLLRGRALQDAEKWAEGWQTSGRELAAEDREFLKKSRETVEQLLKEFDLSTTQAKVETKTLLERYQPQLARIADRPDHLIEQIRFWTGFQPELTAQLCRLLVRESEFPANTEAERVKQIVKAHLLLDWENQVLGDHLKTIRDRWLDNFNCDKLLQLYQEILQEKEVFVDDSSTQRDLLKLGLVESQEEQLKIANPIYSAVFDSQWIEQALLLANQRQIIDERYEVVKELSDTEDGIVTYLVKDYLRRQYVLKQLTPTSKETSEKIRHLFGEKCRELGKISELPQIPKLIDYSDKPVASSREGEDFYYLVQEHIEAQTLDTEIHSSGARNESEVIDLLITILEVLEQVHQQDVAHLNLKPTNLKRQKNGKIALINFGGLREIVSLTKKPGGTIHWDQVGTSGYVPPENTGKWTRYSRDVYAVGMIGIQALTGIDPSDLVTRKRLVEAIFQSPVSDKFISKITQGLPEILVKMTHPDLNQRYPDEAHLCAATALQDLRKLKKAPVRLFPRFIFPAWVIDKRVYTGSAAGLITVTLAIFGMLGFRTIQVSQSKTLIAQCEQPIHTESFPNISFDALVQAQTSISACDSIINSQLISSNNRLRAANSKGKAYMLVSINSGTVAKQSPQQNLAAAKDAFKKAIAIDESDPQAHFYLGLAKFRTNKPGYEADFGEAIKHYLDPKLSSPQASTEETYLILANLAYYLYDKLDNEGYDYNIFTQADNLYTKAIDLLQLSPKKNEASGKESLTQFHYYQAVLNARARNYAKAFELLNRAYAIEKKTFIQDYQKSIRQIQCQVESPDVTGTTEGAPGETNVYCLPFSNSLPEVSSSQDPDRLVDLGLSKLKPFYSCTNYPVLSLFKLGDSALCTDPFQ